MQNWKKLGLVYDKQSYNSVPVATFLDENIIRIYASSRCSSNKSFPFFIDFDLLKYSVLKEQKINISLGEIGTFDEFGIMPTSLIHRNNQVWIYYVGWNLTSSGIFRNSIGLAISDDGGVNFEKFSNGPILDRSIYDHCFVASNCILEEENFFRMYYLSCNKWEYINGKLTHFYNIKYAESKDAVHWIREGKVCIDFRFENEYAISVPRVLKENGLYKMWYSYRGNKSIDTYRIGYAESINGIDWIRMDENISLEPSNEGWDSKMICYPFIFNYKDEKYMLYNGNSYGKKGIGLAKLQ